MKAGIKTKRNTGKRLWIWLVILLLAAGGAGGYYWWSTQAAGTAQAAVETVKTTRVRQGSITLSATGSGTLTAGQEAALAFSTAGTVAELTVQPGDVVEAGQVLARLADLSDLQAEVNTASQDLLTAQKEADALKKNSTANIANAQLALSDATQALASAKSGLVEKGWTRCDQQTIDVYYYNYVHAKELLEELGDGGGRTDYYTTYILPAKNAVARAQSAYEYCAGFFDYEISASQATFTLAEAQLAQAQETLETLTANAGVDPLELAAAENKIAGAQLALDQANEKLEGATLTAPFAGTILTVEGGVGDSVGTGAFITIADMAHPRVAFVADETDFDKIAIGEQARVVFDSVPDQIFSGKVTQIDPALTSSGGYAVITGLIELNVSEARLLKGMNGTVELIQATAENVPVVPLQAVRDLGDGTYAVFVVGDTGQPRMRVVEIGLQDAASAEIKSGVNIGDTVTTGITETK